MRRTIGSIQVFSADAARATAIRMAGELLNGQDALQQGRQERAQVKADTVSLGDAVKAYVKGKRRGKDGLPLKPRTAHDYLAMVGEGGLLAPIADKVIYKLTAENIREVHGKIAKRSEHSATAAMRLLRAVLNWHGVEVAGSPFAKSTPGRDRIVLVNSPTSPKPIPPEKLAAWWASASARENDASADGLRFQLLTGCRPGEIFGSKFEPGLLVRYVDLEGGRAHFEDTKNRSDHTVYLSHQALEIVRPYVQGKKPCDKVFDVVDPGKTLVAINKVAGVDPTLSPHKLRHTFASVAEETCSAFAVKALLNHASGGDVTARYVGKGEAQLRAAWQTVADVITRART